MNVKRTFSFSSATGIGLIVAGATLIAATYGLVRLSYGLLLPDVQRDLGFDAAAAGAVSAGASVLYCVGAAAGLVLGGRHARLLVAAAGGTAGAGAAGMALAGAFPSFAAWAVLASTGAGLASPAMVAILQRNLRPHARESGQSVVNAGTGPGLVLAGMLALALLPDWRRAWVVAAVVTVAAAGSVLALDRRVSPDAEPRGGLPLAWLRAHLGVITAAFLMGVASAAVWISGRGLLVEAGAPTVLSVVAWIVLGAGGAAVVATVRPMSRLSPRSSWAVTTGGVAGATALLGAAPSVLPLAIAACLVFGWSYTAGSGALIAWTTEIDVRRAATGTALLFIVLVLGQAVGAAVLGALAAGAGFGIAFLLAAAAGVGAVLPTLGERAKRA
ncbi:MFS transporter [Microbacterium sp. JZ31]|uniref:MFS transporter n=1 Tax=Microbacterium sp. JZ31 TaxID=1906274 RepID=UPI0019321B3B|nr:MFS transporter [Microbacterium sp. JZ31]